MDKNFITKSQPSLPINVSDLSSPRNLKESNLFSKNTINRTYMTAATTAIWAIQLGLGSLVLFSGPEKAYAGSLDEKIRTIKYNDGGDNIILTLEQAKRGKRLFNAACSSCHVGGVTKPNPNVGLDIASLGLAYPPRDNVTGLVNYLISPKTFDGETNISELHPCIERANLWNVMRTLTEDDLVAISGHILLQARILGERWGGGKIYY
jgi:photosystem II cytochrome c550